jgi:hypothetical protein
VIEPDLDDDCVHVIDPKRPTVTLCGAVVTKDTSVVRLMPGRYIQSDCGACQGEADARVGA